MTDDRIESLVREAATAFRPDVATRDVARARLFGDDEAEVLEKRERHRRRIPTIWRLASAASFILLLGAIGAYVFWPSQLTLADVQAALEDVEWVHIKYDHGDEWWWNVPRQLSARKSPDGYHVFIDYVAGKRWGYHAGASEQRWIHQDTVQSYDIGTTAWDRIVGHVEDRANLPPERGVWVEASPVVLEGRPTIRFDTYRTDPLDKVFLFEQLWADPAARLPIKIRQKLDAAWRRHLDLNMEFVTGYYDFPDSGPESIYDLGVDPSTPITEAAEGPAPENVLAILEQVERSALSFPSRYRHVTWNTEAVFILHWDGVVTKQSNPYWLDIEGVNYRWQHYFNLNGLDEESKPYHLPLPAAAGDVLAWASNQVPISVTLQTDDRTFQQSGPLPDHFVDADEVDVLIRHGARSSPMLSNYQWPVQLLWPTTCGENPARITVLQEVEGVPDGQIVLRSGAGGWRSDYYIDPTRDFICVRETSWRRDHDGEWVRSRERWLEDFAQLPTGHWYPTQRREWMRASSERGKDRAWITHISIKLLDESDLPDELFDIDVLVEKARELGATIETF